MENLDNKYIENSLKKVQTTDYNQERLDTIKKLYPDLFTLEGKLDTNELKKLEDPENIKEVERYEFRWFGKSKAKREAFMPTDATLIYDEGKSINPKKSENIIIEGENLNVLKLLSSGYRNKIKCIYIDPPYNTGKDFVYRDNYKKDKAEYWEEAGITENGIKIDTNTDASGRYHSNWLNMMYSRLLIARQLMREDGVIFISIDDNEVHHLRKLCDIVFGEENFIGEIPRVTKKAGKSSEHFSKNNDYIILYQKSEETLLNSFLHTDSGFKNSDEWVETRGFYKLNQTLDYGSIQYSPSLDYEIEIEGQIYRPGGVSKEEMQERKQRNPKSDFCWRWSKELFKFGYENGFIVVKGNGSNRIYTKTYQNVVIENGIDGYYIKQEQRTKSLSSLDLVENEFSNDNSKKDLSKIFNDTIFEYSKPVSLLKKLLFIGSNKNDLILDFFAGSGTTAQAVMELNQEDGGNRQCILVQIPEATDPKSEAYIAGYKKISDITIERNKRVVEKLIAEKKSKQPDLFSKPESEKEQLKGLGFKVFRLTKSQFPRTEWRPEIDKTDEENIQAFWDYVKVKELQLTQTLNINDLLTEILIKRGFELTFTVEEQPQFTQNKIQLVKDSEKTAYICLDAELKDETVEYFKTNTDTKFICLERALDTTKKWNLKHYMKEKIDAF